MGLNEPLLGGGRGVSAEGWWSAEQGFKLKSLTTVLKEARAARDSTATNHCRLPQAALCELLLPFHHKTNF